MVSQTRGYFDELAGTYDSFARRGMPRYGEMLDSIMRYLPDSPARVLELGCGTGALTVLLAHRFPDAQLAAVDGAPEMVRIARERLAAEGVGARATVEVAVFEEMRLEDQAVELITSNMSLHHIEDKASFYARLRAALRPAGLLVFGDELAGAHQYVEQLHIAGWQEYARRPGHLTEDEIAGILRHAEQFDHYETLPRQLELLAAAGFAPVDCVWRYLNYAVFIAQA